MSSKLVSIIMPAYNAEKYLPQSIGSVQAQTYENWELLIVDDGSTDNSRALVEAVSSKDPRVKLMCNQHGGTARARNTALDVAKGDYVAFIDADDAYHPAYLEQLVNAACANNAELVICGFFEGNDFNVYLDHPLEQGSESVSVDSALIRMYTGQWALLISPWNKLYATALFQDVRFPEGRYFEDASTTNRTIKAANKVCFINSKLYFYHITPGSSSKTKRSVELLDREWALRSHWEQFLKEGRKDLAYCAIQFYLSELPIIYYKINHSDKPEDCRVIRSCFKQVYKKYHKKIQLTPIQIDQYYAICYPRHAALRIGIRQNGFVKAIIGTLKRKLRKIS